MSTPSDPAADADRTIVLTRVFHAPRERVFRAWTDPVHLNHWWGPRGFTTTHAMAFRVGGEWRYTMHGPDGSEHPFCGEYREIDSPTRYVQPFVYDVPVIRDHPAIETATFDERDGRTTLSVTIRHATKEARDGHLQSGMESGMNESHERLEELLAELSDSHHIGV